MRKFYPVLFFTIVSAHSLAQRTLIYAVNSGDWSTASTWSIDRPPSPNDSIIIPAGKVVVISGDHSLSNITLKIYGTLTIDEAVGTGTSNDLDISTTTSKSSEMVVRLMDAASKIQRGLNSSGSGRIRIQVNSNGNYITKYSTSNIVLEGAATAYNNTIGEFSIQTGNSLPVILLDFFISNTKNSVTLRWKSQQENNNDRYIVERSNDAGIWKNIAEVKAVTYSTIPQNYSYTDLSPDNGINYYRLRLVGGDGKFGLTQVKAARISTSSGKASIYPNPAVNMATIFINDENAAYFRIHMYNRTGQLVTSYNLAGGSNIITADVSKLPPGDYSVEIESNTGNRQVLRFLVARK